MTENEHERENGADDEYDNNEHRKRALKEGPRGNNKNDEGER